MHAKNSKPFIAAAVLLASSLYHRERGRSRRPPLLWGQWLIGFDAEGWSGNCKDGHGYEVLTVEPRRMFVNEFGCTITSVTAITKRAAPIANAGLRLAGVAHLLRRGPQGPRQRIVRRWLPYTETFQMMYTRKIGLGLAGGALVMYLGHGYGHAIDVSCPREVRLLPACAARVIEGPSAPPLASVMIASTTSSTSTVATGRLVRRLRCGHR